MSSVMRPPQRDDRAGTDHNARQMSGLANRARASLSTSTQDPVLEGVVTNVAAFGAFVDVGVHQDGLVHISAMANTYVSDPRKIATPGEVVRV